MFLAPLLDPPMKSKWTRVVAQESKVLKSGKCQF